VRILIIIVVAYLLTGLILVWRDVRAHIVHQPAYAREYTVRGRLSPLILAIFTWPAFTLAAWTLPGTRLSDLKKEATHWLLFAVLVGVGLILWDIRRSLGYVIVPVAVLWFLWSWFKWHAKQRGDQNELDVLEETVQEHERGRHDNTEYIKKQIFIIERDHKPTPEVQRLLERARRAIQG